MIKTNFQENFVNLTVGIEEFTTVVLGIGSGIGKGFKGIDIVVERAGMG